MTLDVRPNGVRLNNVRVTGLATAGLITAGPFVAAQLLDRHLADPQRWHPVAGFGKVAAALESRMYRDDRRAGARYAAVTVGGPVLAAAWAQRRLRRAGSKRGRLIYGTISTLTAWYTIGGTSLVGEGTFVAGLLESDQFDAARARLSHLCARDPSELDEQAMARATVESLAENTSDAVVAPLFWLLVAGLPGVVGYRAVNTLDAMVGYRSSHYENFGWAAARTDDVLNLAPARLTGALTAVLAPVVGGDVTSSWATMRRDAPQHPSPNAGYPEAAFAGALGVRLGGTNTYDGQAEQRPTLGDGRAATRRDIMRAATLSRRVSELATVVLASAAFVNAFLKVHKTRDKSASGRKEGAKR